MSHCLMYKKGDSAVIRGVECDFVRIKYSEIELYKSKGYVISVEELTESEEVTEELTESDFLSVFNASPEKLNKDELVKFGNLLFGLELSKRMKEATLIDKIKEVM